MFYKDRLIKTYRKRKEGNGNSEREGKKKCEFDPGSERRLRTYMTHASI